MVLEGIQAAIKGGVTHILVGSDSTLLVDTLNKQKIPKWRLKTNYNSIQQLLRNFEATQITHNHREVNRAAHSAATFARFTATTFLW